MTKKNIRNSTNQAHTWKKLFKRIAFLVIFFALLSYSLFEMLTGITKNKLLNIVLAAFLWTVYFPFQVYTEDHEEAPLIVQEETEPVTVEFNPIDFSVDVPYILSTSSSDKQSELVEWYIWDYLYRHIGNSYGVAGLMGNLYAESRLRPQNLQNSYEKKLKMTDDEYTSAVNNGVYSKSSFINDWAGYGIAQWTDPTRKENLYVYMQDNLFDINDLEGQLGYLVHELGKYGTVLQTLKFAESIKQASDAVLLDFEKPKDKSDKVKKLRASYGEGFFDKFADQYE